MNTHAHKIIENHLGRAMVKQTAPQFMLQMPPGLSPAPARGSPAAHSRCGWVYAPVLWRPFSIINFARRDINNELGELSRIARVLHPGMAFRHRDSSDEE